MGSFFVYMIKSGFCLIGFYLFFRLLLSKETFHRFNRIALISLLVLSSILPAIQVALLRPEEMGQLISFEDLLLVNQDTAMVDSPAPSFSVYWQSILLLIYLIGVFGFLLRQCWVFIQMFRLLRKGTCISDKDGIRTLVYDCNISPFSWMNNIVVSRSDLQENGEAIIAHETAHIRKYHSLDILIVDFCIILQWFNPVAWLLKRELQNIHEYEADEEVLNQGINARDYQLLLIKKAVGTRRYSIANSFNHTSLKKRITMMCKRKSNPWARMKYLYVLPLAAVAVSAFARTEISDELSEISNSKISDLTEIVKTIGLKNSVKNAGSNKDLQVSAPQDTLVFEVVEQPPRYPGGEIELMKYLQRNIKYPADAQKRNAQGRVIVNFIVEKDGSISNIRAVRSVDPSLDAEAIRVVGSMPKWEPAKQRGQAVRVRYTLPVQFRLQGNDGIIPDPESDQAKNTDKDVMVVGYADQKSSEGTVLEELVKKLPGAEVDDEGNVKINGKKVKKIMVNDKEFFVGEVPTESTKSVDGKNVMYILDGKEVSSLDGVKQSDISTVNVLKDQEILEKYGAKGKDAVIIVSTKQASRTSSIPVDEKNVMYIVDGKQVSSMDGVKVNQSDIATVSVLKSQESLEKFGAKDKDAVIIISTKQHERAVSQNDIFDVVEEMPEYPGGINELTKFLQENMKYPDKAKEAGIQGRVMVQFVVAANGSISDTHVVNEVDPLLEAEALRVVNSMPKWKPGKVKGNPVRTRFTLPLNFNLR